jgi:hypothetical protein
VRSRAPPASPSGVSSPRDPSRGEAEASPDDRSPHRVRAALSMQDARRRVNEASRCRGRGLRPLRRRLHDGDQPRFHGPGAGRAEALVQRDHRTAFVAGGSLPSALAGLREGELPQPDPLGHLSSRDRGRTGWRVRRGRHAPVRERAEDDLTARAPAPAKGRNPRTLDDPLARGRLRGPPRIRLATDTKRHRSRRVACADTSGARAAFPVLPRRSPRSAAPEVPSVGDPAPPRRGRSLVVAVRTERVRPVTGVSPQAVANLWEILDAFYDLAGSAALDGATGRRSGGVRGGGTASILVPWNGIP